MAVGEPSRRLPDDIIHLIADQTDDLATLNNWVEASVGCATVHTLVLRRRCRKLAIDFFNLLLDPKAAERGWKINRSDEDGRLFPCYEGEEVEPISLSPKWLSEEVGNGLAPVSFVQQLSISVDPPSSQPYDKVIEGWDPWRQRRPAEQVSFRQRFVDDLLYTLGKILPLTSNLRHIHHHGQLERKCLDLIVETVPSSCQSLIFRDNPLRYHNFLNGFAPPDESSPRINWSPLSRLPGLRVLKIMWLEPAEAHSLWVVVSTLEHLEELFVRAGGSNFRDRQDVPSALQGFFDLVLRGPNSNQEAACYLPSSLRSLGFVDTGLFTLRIDPPRKVSSDSSATEEHSMRPFLPRLKRIHLDFPMEGAGKLPVFYRRWPTMLIPYLVHGLFAWLTESPLTHVAVHGVPFRSDDMRRYTTFPLSILDHHHATLQEVIIFDISVKNHQQYAEANFHSIQDSPFQVTSVVVGTRAAHHLKYSSPDTTTERQILSKEVTPWSEFHNRCPHIRHLRIEQMELDVLELSDFQPILSNLRVLMVYPWAYSDNILSSQSQSEHPTSENVATAQRNSLLPWPDSPEDRFLRHVVPRFSHSLRIVFVGSYRIWLKHQAKVNDRGVAVGTFLMPIPLSQAKLDLDERAIMDIELTSCDWDFVASVPLEPVQDLSPPARARDAGKWNMLDERVIQERNYYVLTKKDQ